MTSKSEIKDRKTTVFLGAYLNFTNAQNINCRALAIHLDKSKFEVYSLNLFSGNLPLVDNVKYFRCFQPLRISKYLGYAWGIYKADVAYLPKTECNQWNRFLLRLLKRKSFSTIEGVLSGTNLTKALKVFRSKAKLLRHYEKFDKLYSITNFLKEYNSKVLKLDTDKAVLPLGVNSKQFSKTIASNITAIVMVGNQLQYKGLEDYLHLACNFPNLHFHIVGSTSDRHVQKMLSQKKLTNVICHEKLNHKELIQLFKKVQLHVLPSRAEGFPKVILEAASAGIPSLIYSDYGATEWIKTKQNGFVVDTVSEMAEVIKYLLDKPVIFSKLSVEAVELGQSFDWKVTVKSWEIEISSIASNTLT